MVSDRRQTAVDEPPFGTYGPNRLQRGMIAVCSRPPFNRGAFRYRLARQVLKRGPGKLDVRFRGGAFRIHNDNHTTEYAILLNQRYNGPEIDFLVDGLPEGGRAVDLGANIGLYAICMALKVGPRGRVVAIDASSDFLERLAFNAAASGLDNVTVLNIAVGDRETMARLVPVEGNAGTATTQADAGGAVRMRPLLSVLRDEGIASLDAMKVDIDGGENAALVPFFTEAEDALLPRRLVVEHLFMDGGADTLKAIENRQYRLAGKTRSNLLYERAVRT